MLKTRLITGISLIVLLLIGLFTTDLFAFVLMASGVLLAAAWELSALVGWQSYWARGLYVVICTLLMTITLHLLVYPLIILVASIICWLLALWEVLLFPRQHLFIDNRWITTSISIVMLLGCWEALIGLRALPQGELNVLLLLAILTVVDSSAFFVGKFWGKRPLAIALSPGKTWVGFYGGLFVGIVFAMLVGPLLLNLNWQQMFSFLIVVVLSCLAAVLGDLFESMLKRKQGVKDSGHILPGHGGLLDRLDSLLASAPIFGLGIVLLYNTSL
ncbi:MAG: phosphatidate cytidylyltransferase [Gammaproteobacteria bacterium]